VRRCLHTFLIALLTIALSTDAARACWFLRARRQCRPVAVSRPCPPPVRSECGTVVVSEWAISDGCCQPVACAAVAACCDGGVVEGQESVVASEVVVDRDAESPTQSVVRDQPTLAGDSQAPAAPANPQPEPPAPRAELIQPASNNELLPDLEPVDPSATAILPADEPAPPAAEAEPEMEDEDLPAADVAKEEMPDEAAPGLPLPPVTEAPADKADEEEMADEVPPPPRRPLPPLPGIDDDEPEMEEEAVEPPPAVKPEPESEPNLFEEFEDGATAGDESDEEMAAETEETNPFAGADESTPPAAPADAADEPADLPFGDDSAADDEDPLMADDETEPAADADDAFPLGGADDDEAPMADAEDAAGEPAAPIDPDDEPRPVPADDSDPFAGVDDSDSLAAAEPVRRWIHASGAHSLVARLIDVAADGGCLLETEGRQIRVPLANLSGHDRDYIRSAGVRLAALREARERAAAAAATTTPQATDTAGL